MDIEEIKKIVDGNPDELIKFAEKHGIDFSGLNKDIAKMMVKEKFAITDDDFEAVDFVFWVSYLVERDAGSLIIEPEVIAGARRDAMESIVNKLHFGEKIKIISELYTSKEDPFIKFMRQIQDLRNDIAHGRFGNLKYGGYHLSDNRGKLKLIANFRDVLRKKS